MVYYDGLLLEVSIGLLGVSLLSCICICFDIVFSSKAINICIS